MEVKVIEEEINVAGSQIFQRKYHHSKNTKNMLLLHGWAFTSKNWEDIGVFDHFSRLGFNVYAIDYPGFGKSPSSEKYGIDRGKITNGSKLVNDYLAASGLDHAFLLGASMGGGIVMHSILDFPQKVDGVIAVAPAWVENEENRMKKIEKPVLFIWGSEDSVISPDLGKIYSKAVNGSELEIIKGAGHPAYLHNPEEFFSLTEKFLKKFS